MISKVKLPYSETNSLNSLVLDYINRSEKTKELYSNFPDLDGYKAFLNTPDLFSHIDRKSLGEELLLQSRLTNNVTEQSLENIQRLNQPDSFTIVTGHQLCLFTGPLYFIYKIVSVIKISQWLQKNIKGKKFVPVYWMASEDHDAEEINHAFIYGKKIEWNTSQSGAVGEFVTIGIEDALRQLEDVLGKDTKSQELINLFKEAYTNYENLADATRYIVNALFGKYGIVVVDGKSDYFKSQATDLFSKDLFGKVPYNRASATTHSLQKKGYPVQVNPRESNCFFLEKEHRYRIDNKGERYELRDANKSFSADELNELLKKHPEKFSPNVILRPAYQQHILPNISYVGGQGEISYWLQYKSMFEGLNITFPILHLRQFTMIIPRSITGKLDKYLINIPDLFLDTHALINKYSKEKGITTDFEEEKHIAASLYERLVSKAEQIDKSLIATVKAEMQKSLNGINALETKINKALKAKSETEIQQIETIKSKLFPENTPQERHDNLSMHYNDFGTDFIDTLMNEFPEEGFNYLVLAVS